MSARLVVPATALLSMALLGACTGGVATKASNNPATAPPVVVQNQAASQIQQAKLVAKTVADVGQVLTDQNGMTLYRFDKDTTKPPVSTCDGDCAAAWPPVLATGSVDVEGVDPALVGTLTRSDGTTQVTVSGWAVYRYAKDTAPGQAKGQGVGGVWNAITPAGGKAVSVVPAAPQPEAATVIETANIPGLDTVLTDQNGLTLYLFTKDTKKPSKSTCDGACATAWPPLLAVGDVGVSGADKKLLGTLKRADGTEQVTYGGWPLYRYAKDTAPGQANGHAVGGTWFEVEPAGCKVAEGKKPINASGSLSGASRNTAGDPGSSSY